MNAPANQRVSTIEEILGRATTIASNIKTTAQNTIAQTIPPQSGNYILSVLFYFLMYSFILFLALLLIHFTIKPIFQFIPGGKGFIPVPGTTNDEVFWNSKKQPPPSSAAPDKSSELSAFPFDNNFSFSIDLYIRKLPSTDVKGRIILIKGDPSNDSLKTILESSSNPIKGTETIESKMNTNATSMIVYLTETNDLVVCFFANGIAYPARPIYNIPLYTPFRLSVVVEERLFTVYLNGKQNFQRIVINPRLSGSLHKFISPPTWAEAPTKTIFLQNLHVWPRTISSSEVIQAQPALAQASDFDMPAEPDSTSCY